MITPQQAPGISHISTNDEHIYLNINIRRQDGARRSPAIYTETRSTEVIPKGDDYLLAVARFTIPPGNIPMYIFQIEEGIAQSNPNLGVMKFTLEYGGVPYTENVIYVPDSLNNPVPNPPSANPPSYTQVDSTYYYIYVIEHLLTLFNTALDTAFTALKTANPGAPQTEPPFFKRLTTGEWVLVYPENYLDPGNEIEIWFNQPTERWFEGFYKEFEDVSADQYARFILDPWPLYDNGYEEFGVAPTNPPVYLQKVQQYDNTSSWVDLNKIIFRTSLIPIRQEFIGSSSTEGQDITEAILTDFDVSGWKGDREEIVFFPQAPYRYIDILSHMPLRTFNIEVLWEDLQGVIRPIFVFGRSIDVKLAFVRKHLVS